MLSPTHAYTFSADIDAAPAAIAVVCARADQQYTPAARDLSPQLGIAPHTALHESAVA